MKAHQVVRHGVDFILLVVVISLGLGGLFYFRFDTAAQVATVILMAILYVFWGIFHHFHDGNLAGKVVLEYISIAALVTFILVIFLLRV